MEAVAHEIIGVMPRGFRIVDSDADILVPLRLERSGLVRNAFAFLGVARLKRGTTIDDANADLARMFPAWLNGWPGGSTEFYKSMRITPDIRPLKQEVVGGAPRSARARGGSCASCFSRASFSRSPAASSASESHSPRCGCSCPSVPSASRVLATSPSTRARSPSRCSCR